VQAEDERESLVLEVLRKSSLAQRLNRMFTIAINRSEKAFSKMESTSKSKFVRILKQVVSLTGMALVVALFGWAIFQALQLVAALSFDDYITVATAALFSVMRTTAALFLAFLWTVPLGVYIGLNQRASRVLQPLVQVVASIPATAVFPVILLFLIQLGGGLGIGSVFLMLLGTQWYILFNVIAGASAIPQDLKEVTKLYGLKGIEKWKVLILPGIFPYLVTGLITATGGAWNATIVSEYVTFGGETLKTVGLGSLIGESTANGNFGLLLMSTLVMAVIVVSINRLLWKRLFALAQEKYRLE
jgi:NitT/TauT family transport system permease protein